MKRTAAAPSAAVAGKTTTAKASAPKNSFHRHSKPSVSAAPVIDHNEIAKLAYKYWEERHHADGFADEDWQRAEKALSARA